MNLKTIFNAGRVRRWHSNPDMSWTNDYNDAHQGRVARILLALHPDPSGRLLAAALIHDDGESATGDMCQDVKNTNPGIYKALQTIEDAATCEIWGIGKTPASTLSPDDCEWLKFADRLDAYMWMMHKQPVLANRDDWYEARMALEDFAKAHEIWSIVRPALHGK